MTTLFVSLAKIVPFWNNESWKTAILLQFMLVTLSASGIFLLLNSYESRQANTNSFNLRGMKSHDLGSNPGFIMFCVTLDKLLNHDNCLKSLC